MVVVQDGGRQTEELKLLPPGLVVVEGVELHGRFYQQLSLFIALHLAQRQHAADQQLPPVLFGQDVGFACGEPTDGTTTSFGGGRHNAHARYLYRTGVVQVGSFMIRNFWLQLFHLHQPQVILT